MKLTLKLVAEASDGTTPSNLALANKDLHKVSCLKALTNLVRLDLSNNRIKSIKALSTCKSLKWLSVARNDLRSLSGIESLSALLVLNGSGNQIQSMQEVESLAELRALIVNDNQISSVCKLQKLTALNTLVLSKNPLESIGTSLEEVSSLRKLSLSNCQLRDLGSLTCLAGLKELRLSRNKIKHLSQGLSNNRQLQIIDLGNNRLKRLSDIEVLSALPLLRNLNIRENPLCLQENYESKVRSMLPSLQVLDGHSVKSSSKKRPVEQQSASPSTTKLTAGLDGHAVKSSSKKRPLEQQSASPSTTKLTVGHEVGLHLSKKSRQHDKIGRYEAQLSDKSIDSSIKQTHQKAQKAVKDHKGSMLEDTLRSKRLDLNPDKIARNDSHLETSDNDDDKPFIELTVQEAGVEQVAKDIQRRGQGRKSDSSGLVTIIDNRSKDSKRKHRAKAGSVCSLPLGEVEVGAGGFSSWD